MRKSLVLVCKSDSSSSSTSAIMSATAVNYIDKLYAETEKARIFAEQRYNTLLVSLKELQNHWPAAAWFLRICQHVDSSKGRELVESSHSTIPNERLLGEPTRSVDVPSMTPFTAVCLNYVQIPRFTNLLDLVTFSQRRSV